MKACHIPEKPEIYQSSFHEKTILRYNNNNNNNSNNNNNNNNNNNKYM